jgi:hypothetical protein
MPGKLLYRQGRNQCEKTLVIPSDNRERYGGTFREGETLLILGGAMLQYGVWFGPSIFWAGRDVRLLLALERDERYEGGCP